MNDWGNSITMSMTIFRFIQKMRDFIGLYHFEVIILLKFWNFFKNFIVFVNRRWSPSVPNKYKTFIQSCLGTTNPRKQFTLPVHSLKNYGPLNSQTTGKEKNSNFNVENFVVMFTYWVTIIAFLFLYKSFKKVYTEV
jgi:hypothetical protein